MELRHLRYFLVLADQGTFQRAAEVLGMTQPPLSRQIAELETELGVRLFTRTAQGSRLTPAGESFAVRAREALDATEAGRVEVQKSVRAESGRLALGFLPSAFQTFLPEVLAQFTRRWPRVRLEPVEIGLTADAVTALRAGSIDLAVGRPPFNASGTTDDLLALPLLNDDIHVVLSSGHPLSGRKHIKPAMLRAERFVLTPLEERPPHYWDEVCSAAGFTPTVASRVQGAQTVIGMVAAGIGVGLVPRSASTSPREDVVFLPLEPPVIAPPLTLVWQASSDNELIERFVAVVHTVLGTDDSPMQAQKLNSAYLSALRRQIGRIDKTG